MRTMDQVRVPCGHCLGCRADQARSWAIRLIHEADAPLRPAWFATLTYSPENVPDHGSLDPRHTQLFFKRFRKSLRALATPEDLRYYICGEYGDATQRPHYHAILYGPSFLDRWDHRSQNGAPVFRSSFLEESWTYGLSEFTGLTYAAARYTAGYVRKKLRAADHPEGYTRVDPETGELVQLQPEFGRMSRRPAIGLRWIERHWRDVYPADFVPVDGMPLKPPRYYDKWMDDDHSEKQQTIRCRDCSEHRQVMMEVRRKRIEEAKELESSKLEAREKIHQAKVALFQGRDAV